MALAKPSLKFWFGVKKEPFLYRFQPPKEENIKQLLVNLRKKKLAEIGKRQSSTVANATFDRRLTSGQRPQVNIPLETGKRKNTIEQVSALKLVFDVFRPQI